MAKRAMLFAAGLGTRMRPLTEHTPKALIELAGKPLLDYALERFEAAGVERVVVNTHHLAEQIAAHLAVYATHMDVVRVHEERLLETGGGVLNALPWLGDEPFFTANMDTLWLDGRVPALERLRAAFDPEQMDALLLLQPLARTVGYGGRGDFALSSRGEVVRGREREYVFSGLQILHPRTLAGRAITPFSIAELWWERARPDGTLARVFGLVHDGDWLHVGTPAELHAAEQFLRSA
jgi:MurNAc alpha-1-phosphate uridylyltransferase